MSGQRIYVFLQFKIILQKQLRHPGEVKMEGAKVVRGLEPYQQADAKNLPQTGLKG